MNQKVLVVTHADAAFELPAWAETLPLLRRRGHAIVGIALVPSHLGKLRGFAARRWYLETFGPVNVLILGAFSIARAIRGSIRGFGPWKIGGWKDFRKSSIPVREFRDSNDPDLVAWVRSEGVDILLITVDDILKKEIISAPRLGVINKHAALLPACRGLFPFFWALKGALPLGVSYHLVDESIDTGNILFQEDRSTADNRCSMLGFYRGVFSRFPVGMATAIENLVQRRKLPAPDGISASYFSLPTRADVREFEAMGHRIARWSDLLG